MEGSIVEIRDDRGAVLGARAVGRIFVNTPSLMSGYYHNDEATAAVVGQDGFLDTGDMGYWLDGEIVITGRAKDLILHNGRNIWPQDIEWAAEQIEPLRAGDVAAFAVENDAGEDEVTVLVNGAELGTSIDRSAAEAELESAQQAAAAFEGQAPSTEKLKAQQVLARAKARLAAAAPR